MTDDDRGEGQRRQPRLPVRLIVEYEDADDFIGDYTTNLSAGGTFVHTNRVLEMGTEVSLVLSFPGLLLPIALAGIVRWSRGGSQPGAGIEFLPGRDLSKLQALVTLIEARDPRAVSRLIRVLVAEDNPHVSELICAGLGASAQRTFGGAVSFQFATAEDGASALELLRTSPFDVAIIDLFLPVIDGAKVIDHARATLGLSELAIIAISEHHEAARSSAISMGANMYLRKPMRLREVLDSMCQLVAMSA